MECFPPGSYKVGKSLDSNFESNIKKFYQEKWQSDPKHLPTQKYDPMEFRQKFTASVTEKYFDHDSNHNTVVFTPNLRNFFVSKIYVCISGRCWQINNFKNHNDKGQVFKKI